MIEKPNLQESLYGFDTIFNEIALLYQGRLVPVNCLTTNEMKFIKFADLLIPKNHKVLDNNKKTVENFLFHLAKSS